MPADDPITEVQHVSHRLTPAAVTIVVALLAAAPAEAASLAVKKRCYRGGDEVEVQGAQFSPNTTADVRIEGREETVVAQVGAAGTFTALVRVPRFRGAALGPQTFTVSATSSSPGNTANPISVWAVRRMLATNAPIAGDAAELTTWRFAGFRPRKVLYGHFRHRGATRRTYRFGTVRELGPCGALSVRAPRLPVPVSRLRPGMWQLQLDHRKRYGESTRPRTIVTFQVFRRMGA
jgi:hypothetical protein